MWQAHCWPLGAWGVTAWVLSSWTWPVVARQALVLISSRVGKKKSFTYASEIGKPLTKNTHFDRKEEFHSPNVSH